MAHQYLDDLIKEYLLFRGFTNSLRAFDADIKGEKEKSFRADRYTTGVSIQICANFGINSQLAHLCICVSSHSHANFNVF